MALQTKDVATIGTVHVTQTDLNALLDQARQGFKSQHRAFPTVGTPTYQTLKSQAVTLLVQKAERQERAKSMGITVSPTEVDQRIAQIKKQYFGGSTKLYEAALKQNSYTDAGYRDNVEQSLLSQKVFNVVTKNVKVSDADARAYFDSHKTLYQASRSVRHVLVKSKALADTLYAQLKSGADTTWCKLAKQYSQDPGSKSTCGQLDIKRGQTVPPFDKTAFGLKVHEVAKPIHSQFGWHIIEALGPIQQPTFASVKAQIQQQLLQDKKNQAMTDWVNGLTKDFCSGARLKYQAGYQPTPDPCTAVTTSTASTT